MTTLPEGADRDWLLKAIEELARLHERQAAVMRMRFFGGITVEKTAEILKVSPQTIKADTRVAYQWLCKRYDESNGR